MKIRTILSLSMLILCAPFSPVNAHASPALAASAPPLHFLTGAWPGYASDAVFVTPEPPVPGVAAELCASVVNDGAAAHTATLEFSKAALGVAMVYTPIGTANFDVPAGGQASGCTPWPNPDPGIMGIQVTLLQAGNAPQISQRNIDAREALQPGVSNDLIFLVRNPQPAITTITLGMVPHLSGWALSLSQDVLPNMAPGQVLSVTLTVTPPTGVDLPADYDPIVDVEGYAGAQLIGGFRKVFRPPVALHTRPDPVYAERDLKITPYPLQAGQPINLCATLHNPYPNPRSVSVQFSWASFGIGANFTPIAGASAVALNASSAKDVCIIWVPPIGGFFNLQATLTQTGYATQYSQRNVAVIQTGLQPGVPFDLTFSVKNTTGSTATITLGMIPTLSGWSLELSQDVLTNMLNGEVRPVTLTITPPVGVEFPTVYTPIVDLVGFIASDSIGGLEVAYVPEPPSMIFMPLIRR
jgi:hypothetical protein